MKIKWLVFINLFILGFFSNITLAGKTSETLFSHAHSIFERSLAGDDSVTGVALNQFRMLSMTYPDNPLFLAYKGACYALMARDAWFWEKNNYIDKGLDNIAEALQMLKPMHDHDKMRGVPISVETRLVAVSTFSDIPQSFNHFDKAKEVLNDLLQSSAFKHSPMFLKARIYWQAAKVARLEAQSEEEIKYLQKILRIAPQGELHKKTRDRLRELGG